MICLPLTVAKAKITVSSERNAVSWRFNMQVHQESSLPLGLEQSWSGVTAFVQSRNSKYHKEKKITTSIPTGKSNVCSAMQQYGKENLRELLIKMVVEYVHGTIIPLTIAEEKKVPVEEVRGDEERNNEAKKKLLRQYGLTSIRPSTMYMWMKLLGVYLLPKEKILC
jgi:hypothetical protein